MRHTLPSSHNFRSHPHYHKKSFTVRHVASVPKAPACQRESKSRWATSVPRAAASGVQEGRFTLKDGLSLETIFQKEGDAEKPALLFIHGAGHGAWCWQKFLPYFNELGFPVYSISLRGQAGSDAPPGAKVGGTLHQHASDVAAYIKQEIKRPAVIVGHSFGGLIVHRYTTGEFPNIGQLQGAVLLASATPAGNSGMVNRFFLRNPFYALKLTWFFIRRSYLKNPEATRWLFFSDDLPDKDLQRYFDLLVSKQSKVPAVDVGKFKEELKELGKPPATLPVLVMGAENDASVDAEGVQETADFYSVAPVVIPNMAHDMMLSWKTRSGSYILPCRTHSSGSYKAVY